MRSAHKEKFGFIRISVLCDIQKIWERNQSIEDVCREH